MSSFLIPGAKRVGVVMEVAATVTETHPTRFDGGTTDRPGKRHDMAFNNGLGWGVVVRVVAVVALGM